MVSDESNDVGSTTPSIAAPSTTAPGTITPSRAATNVASSNTPLSNATPGNAALRNASPNDAVGSRSSTDTSKETMSNLRVNPRSRRTPSDVAHDGPAVPRYMTLAPRAIASQGQNNTPRASIDGDLEGKKQSEGGDTKTAAMKAPPPPQMSWQNLENKRNSPMYDVLLGKHTASAQPAPFNMAVMDHATLGGLSGQKIKSISSTIGTNTTAQASSGGGLAPSFGILVPDGSTPDEGKRKRKSRSDTQPRGSSKMRQGDGGFGSRPASSGSQPLSPPTETVAAQVARLVQQGKARDLQNNRAAVADPNVDPALSDTVTPKRGSKGRDTERPEGVFE